MQTVDSCYLSSVLTTVQLVVISYTENLTVKGCINPPYDYVKSSLGWDT